MPHKLTRRALLAGAGASAALASVPAIAANPLLRRLGHPHGAGATLLHTFAMQEVNGAASRGLFQVGLPLAPNSVMPGDTLEVRRADGVTVVPAQFDLRSSYRATSEGLKFVAATVADASNFTANELRTYTVYKKTGSYNNTAATTLAAALSGHDYNVYFPNITDSVAGALSDITVNLAAFAATASRVTQYQSGPYKNSWEIWGETSHAQLIVTFYYSQIRDASGNIISDELVAEPGMFWWDVAKSKMIYDAELKDGATSIVSYTSVNHNPQAMWYMVRTQNDNQHALPVWNGDAIPTLMYIPDKTAWKNSGLIPKYRTDLTYNFSVTANTYIPGRALGHRYGISGGGAFMAEGVIPSIDIMTFGNTTTANVRKTIVNALVGGHISLFHNRLNAITTKPGKSADKANTITAQWMWDQRGKASVPVSDPYTNFTADGMPTPAEYYTHSGAPSPSLVLPTSAMMTQPDGAWEWTADNAHAVNYAYFAYLYTGYRHYLRSVIDNANHRTEINALTVYTGEPPLDFYDPGPPAVAIYPGAPSTPWSAIVGRAAGSTVQRVLGRGHGVLASGAIIPDGEVETNYIDKIISHNIRFSKASFDLIPVSGNGTWGVGTAAQSTFMYGYCTLFLYHAADVTRSPDLLAIANYIAQYQIHFAASGYVGTASAFHTNTLAVRHPATYPDPTTNPFRPITDPWPTISEGLTSSPQFLLTGDTVSGAVGNFPYQNGDRIVFAMYSDINAAQVVRTLPPEISSDTVYYVVNATGTSNTSFQFSDTIGGAPIVTSGSNVLLTLEIIKEAARDPTKWIGAKNSSDYGLNAMAGFLAARHHNHPLATSAGRDAFQAMYGSFPIAQQPYCAYDVT